MGFAGNGGKGCFIGNGVNCGLALFGRNGGNGGNGGMGEWGRNGRLFSLVLKKLLHKRAQSKENFDLFYENSDSVNRKSIQKCSFYFYVNIIYSCFIKTIHTSTRNV